MMLSYQHSPCLAFAQIHRPGNPRKNGESLLFLALSKSGVGDKYIKYISSIYNLLVGYGKQ